MTRVYRATVVLGLLSVGMLTAGQSRTQHPKPEDQERSSYTPVVEEPFEEVRKRDKAA